MLLKDRNKTPTEEEHDWYERAFGRKRNTMRYSVRYVPLFDSGRKGLCDFYIKLHYKPFPEMAEEFNLRDYDKYREIWIKMNGEEDENDNWAYEYELELPLGDWKYSYFYKLRSTENEDKTPLPDGQMDTLKARLEPEAVSAEQ